MGEPSKPRFVLLGAGLPRNGTLSTRAALGQLLGGEVRNTGCFIKVVGRICLVALGVSHDHSHEGQT